MQFFTHQFILFQHERIYFRFVYIFGIEKSWAKHRLIILSKSNKNGLQKWVVSIPIYSKLNQKSTHSALTLAQNLAKLEGRWLLPLVPYRKVYKRKWERVLRREFALLLIFFCFHVVAIFWPEAVVHFDLRNSYNLHAKSVWTGNLLHVSNAENISSKKIVYCYCCIVYIKQFVGSHRFPDLCNDFEFTIVIDCNFLEYESSAKYSVDRRENRQTLPTEVKPAILLLSLSVRWFFGLLTRQSSAQQNAIITVEKNNSFFSIIKRENSK